MKPQLILGTDKAEQVLKESGFLDHKHGGLTKCSNHNHTKFVIEPTKVGDIVKALIEGGVSVSIVTC